MWQVNQQKNSKLWTQTELSPSNQLKTLISKNPGKRDKDDWLPIFSAVHEPDISSEGQTRHCYSNLLIRMTTINCLHLAYYVRVPCVLPSGSRKVVYWQTQ
jgi:hypothetical protein